MTPGLFASHCPVCGGELLTDSLGNSACGGCDRAYLNRFGHLIPLDKIPETTSPASSISQG